MSIRAVRSPALAILTPEDYGSVEDNVEAAKHVNLDTMAQLAITEIDQRCVRADASSPAEVEMPRAKLIGRCTQVRAACSKQGEALGAFCIADAPQRKMSSGACADYVG